MPERNPLAGVVPRVDHRGDVDDTAIVEQIEKIEGEVALDGYLKALMSVPEVAERISALEGSLQRLANAALALNDIERHRKLRALAEEAGVLLKSRLEVDDLRRRVSERARAKREAFQDDLRITPR